LAATSSSAFSAGGVFAFLFLGGMTITRQFIQTRF
jgi:hypothetical protein